MSRVSLDAAVGFVLDTIPRDRAVTPNWLSEETGISWRTVKKALNVIKEVQEKLINEHFTVNLERMGRSYILRKTKSLSHMTPEERMHYITENYFPEPSIEEILLVDLLQKEVTTPERAIAIQKDTLVEKLIQQGQFKENSNRKIYLSKMGVMIAKGALKAYPELK